MINTSHAYILHRNCFLILTKFMVLHSICKAKYFRWDICYTIFASQFGVFNQFPVFR